MEDSINVISETLNETRARSEVLLNLYFWDVNELQTSFMLEPGKVYDDAKIDKKFEAVVNNGFFFFFF
jgi:hypothetical protein